jgi:phosphatidylethanolamine/phosphatidyl-N-methylethanolamine N-methyltransferase
VNRQQVVKIYSRYAPFYDLLFSPFFLPRLRLGIEKLGIREGDRILEIGTGTGLSLPFYPPYCRVFAVDVTRRMLEHAKRRVTRYGLSHVTLWEMDGEKLTFRDSVFDHTVLPFVVNVVPHPKTLFEEVKRVTKTYGKILIINHFSNGNGMLSRLERLLSPLFLKLGWKIDFPFAALQSSFSLSIAETTKMRRFDPWFIVTAINSKR